MICYVLAMGKQHLGPHVVVGYGIKIFWPGIFITSPDHLDILLAQRMALYHQCPFIPLGGDTHSANKELFLKRTDHRDPNQSSKPTA